MEQYPNLLSGPWGQTELDAPSIFDEVEEQEALAQRQIAQCGTIASAGTAEGGLAEHCYDVFHWPGGTNTATSCDIAIKNQEAHEKRLSQIENQARVEMAGHHLHEAEKIAAVCYNRYLETSSDINLERLEKAKQRIEDLLKAAKE